MFESVDARTEIRTDEQMHGRWLELHPISFAFVPYFVIQYLVSLLALQSSRCGRESERERERERERGGGGWLLNFNCVLAVVWLLLFCVSSSRRCRLLVCDTGSSWS